jgi:hypothetical protein
MAFPPQLFVWAMFVGWRYRESASVQFLANPIAAILAAEGPYSFQ